MEEAIRIGLASIGRRATCRCDESELEVQRAQIPSLCLGALGALGALGERKKNSEAGARFPAKLEIVPAENTAEGGVRAYRFGYVPMMSSRFTVTQTFDLGS